MIFKYLFLILITSILCSCFGKDEEFKNEINGSWSLTQFQNLNEEIVLDEPQDLNNSIVFIFNEGDIEGHTTSNTFFGNYQIQDNLDLSISSFGGTEVGEPEWGEFVWKYISTVTNFRNDGTSLVLSNDSINFNFKFFAEQ